MTEKKIIAQIIVPRPLEGPFTYLVPDELLPAVFVGSLVRIPFRSGEMEGYVIKVEPLAEMPSYEIKPITGLIVDQPVFDAKDLEFFQWIAEYYQLPLGLVFKSVFSKDYFRIPKKARKAKEREVVEEKNSNLALTNDQSEALKQIASSIESNAYRSFLLWGVTGSGKTEVYMRAAKLALKSGKSALILVPEIALTPQLRQRFEEKFADQVAVLHSGLTPKVRRDFWWDIRNGKKRVVVGARSALFAPLKDIGLIVVDEEHEVTYKQEDHLCYHARDLALVRAKQQGAAVVLGSATPSIETYQATLNGKHVMLKLGTRPLERPMPTIEVVDLKLEPKPKNVYQGAGKKAAPFAFSGLLRKNLLKVHENGEQALIFINRKGYANFLLCADCGFVPECMNCSVSLSYYQKNGTLKCNYCAYEVPPPPQCPQCKSPELKQMGLGTELVEEELRKLIPDAQIARLDAEAANTTKNLEKILEDFRSQKTKFLIGTQMLAKGHDFPNVTLIGIVLADTSLHLPDFRAAERTFQLLAQVAGRSGRADKPGHVILQTYLPEHPVIRFAVDHDYVSFFNFEIQQRKEFEYPPFTRLAQIEFRHMKQETAQKEAQETSKLIKHLLLGSGSSKGVQYLGPAPAGIERIANQYRWQILIKSEKYSELNALIKTLRKNGVQFIDVDPVTSL